MTYKDRIDQFYIDIETLGMKFPGARIKKETGYSKGLISRYLNKELEPSAEFLTKFYEKFGESLKKVSRELTDDESSKEKKDEIYNADNKKLSQNLTEQMLAELIKAHSKQADSLKDISEANLIWARNTESLIAKWPVVTADADQGIRSEINETFARIVAVMVKIGTGTLWPDESTAIEELSNIVPLPGLSKG